MSESTQAAPAAETQAQPAAPGAEWLPAEYRTDPAFASFKDITALAKSFKDTQQFVGADKAHVLRLPKEGGVPDEVWQRLGRPEKAEGYELAAPEGFPDDAMEAFRETAHKLGLPQAQAAGVLEFYQQQQQQARTQMQTQSAEALKREWGAAYDDRMAAAKRAVREVGGDAVLGVLEQSGLGNHPDVIRMFAQIGMDRAEPGALKGGSGGVGMGGRRTPQQAQAAIGAKQRDAEFMKAYHGADHAGHAAAVAEMAELYRQAHPG